MTRLYGLFDPLVRFSTQAGERNVERVRVANGEHAPRLLAGVEGRAVGVAQSVVVHADRAVAEREEFRGTVAFVSTRGFYRRKDVSPSGQAYHWNNNAETYYRIGAGMGEAMLALLAAQE